MGIASEFKEFAMRGSVVDLAVGVVIGAAFGNIVTAFVDKVIMPPIGLLIGGVDFAEWVITLREAAVDAAGEEIPAVVIGIGEFLNSLVQFLIIAFAIFMVIRGINRMNRKKVEEDEPAAPEAPSEDVLLLREIRDSLKSR
ncbi:MAG TPA: large-conductance mechanosensitive channel protein MscL [Candidatus Luteimonas excrementigallinarum]|nr:large-conductance mechanosensitive channel protein MscL [Candidatus Luteimonas excrementigallinarum]